MKGLLYWNLQKLMKEKTLRKSGGTDRCVTIFSCPTSERKVKSQKFIEVERITFGVIHIW